MRFGSWMLTGVLRDAAGEGGEGGGAAGAPPPFDMKVLAELVSTTVAKAVSTTFEARDKAAKTASEAEAARRATEEAERKAAEEAAANGGAGGEGKGTEQKDAATRLLEKRVRDMEADLKKERDGRATEARLAAEQKKESSIRQALDKFEYAKPSGKETAYRHVKDDVKLEDGKLIGPDGSELGVWLKALFEEDLDTLLAPKTTGGSGASGARANGGGAAVDINDITPGGKNLEAARARIAELAKEALRGR
jgi:hypothetical protein